jgi:acetyl-CoA acetyltransferase
MTNLPKVLLDQDVVIVSAKRTPMGAFQGTLSALKASQLGGIAIEGALKAASLSGSDVHEVIMGCVCLLVWGKLLRVRQLFMPASNHQYPAQPLIRCVGRV